MLQARLLQKEQINDIQSNNVIFFIDFKKNTTTTSIQIHLSVPLKAEKDSKSSCLRYERHLQYYSIFNEKTVHKIRSVKPWANQASTLPFVRRFQNSLEGIEKVKENNEGARSVRPRLCRTKPKIGCCNLC